MKRTLLALALVVGLVGISVPAAHADTVLTGTTDGGAFFRIVVPTAWNGDLVIWNHGFSLSPVGPVSDLGPLAALQLSEGYAVAASSYQQIGWALFKTKNDLQNMVAAFKANFGTPNNVLVNGGSLGGIVTAQAIEKANLGNVVGAYPFCGAVAGSRNWDGALDLRLTYDAICGSVPGAAIPGGATGLPAPGYPSFPYTNTQMALAAHACWGILGGQTPAQLARLIQYLTVTQLPATGGFLLTDLGYGVFALSNVIYDPAKLNGSQGIGNANVNYDNGGFIDTTIQRVTANTGGANRLDKNFTPKGQVGSVKIVSTHTSGDGLVIVENEKEYADVVPASNLTTAIVNETPLNTHCGFTGGELVAGWESLRGWVAGGSQPTVASIQATCNAYAPFFGGPCRYDPAFVIPDMDGRIRPR